MDVSGLGHGLYHFQAKFYSEKWQNLICQRDLDFRISNLGFEILTSNSREALRTKPKLTVYPNPAQEEIYIQLDRVQKEKAQIRIFNTLGKEMKSIRFDELPETAIPIEVSNWTNGIYFIQIKVGNQPVINKKLIINRLY